MQNNKKTEASKEASFLQQNKWLKLSFIGLAIVMVITFALSVTFGIKYNDANILLKKAAGTYPISLNIEFDFDSKANVDFKKQSEVMESGSVTIQDEIGWYGKSLYTYLDTEKNNVYTFSNSNLGHYLTSIGGLAGDFGAGTFWKLQEKVDGKFVDTTTGVDGLWLGKMNNFKFIFSKFN